LQGLYPFYHIQADLPLTPPNETIANETIYALEALRKQHDELYEQQFKVLDDLAEKGWKVAQTAAKDGKEGQIAFSHPNGGAFTLPLLGDLQMFDMEAALEQAKLQAAPEMQVRAGGGATPVKQLAKQRHNSH